MPATNSNHRTILALVGAVFFLTGFMIGRYQTLFSYQQLGVPGYSRIISSLFGSQVTTALPPDKEKTSSPSPTSKVQATPTPSPVNQPCNLDLKVCPDGTKLSRTKYSCTFEDCPVATESGTVAEQYYFNETLGVGFTYPVGSVEIIEQPAAHRVTVYSLETYSFSDKPLSLLSFQSNFNVSTYEDKNIPDEIIADAYRIQDRYYDAWQYSLGEGSRCGGGSLTTDAVILREDLFVMQFDHQQSRNTDPACEGEEFETRKTSAQDLAMANQIIQSIDFVEPAQISFTDEELGIDFTYPAGWNVATTSATIPSTSNQRYGLEIEDLLSMYEYQEADTDFKATQDFPVVSQTDFPAIQLADGSRYVWQKQEDISRTSTNQYGYYELTDESTYFIDIPEQISLKLTFKVEKSLDSETEQVRSVRYFLEGTEMPKAVFDAKIDALYAMLQTLEFTE